jgi:hypothetical protein
VTDAGVTAVTIYGLALPNDSDAAFGELTELISKFRSAAGRDVVPTS